MGRPAPSALLLRPTGPGTPIAAAFVILLPLLVQLPDIVLLHEHTWAWLAHRPFAATVTMAAICFISILLGWRAFAPVQRLAWAFGCLVALLGLVLGIRMQAFHGSLGPGVAYPSAVAIFAVWVLIPLLVGHWSSSQLETFVRKGFSLAGIGLAVFSLGSYGFGLGSGSGSGLSPIDSFGIYPDAVRLKSLSGSPGLTAAVLLIFWPALLGRMPWWDKRRWIVGRGVGVFLLVLATLLTYSRASYLGLGAQLIILLFLGVRSLRPHVRLRLVGAAAVVAGSILFTSVAIGPVARRFIHLSTPSDLSVVHRLHLFQWAGTLIMERPLCGWGTGTFGTLYRAFDRIPSVMYAYDDAHSAVFLSLFEHGVLHWLLFAIAIGGWRMRRTLVRVPAWIVVSFAGGALMLLTDAPTFRFPSMLVPLVLMLAVIAGVAREQERRRPLRRRVRIVPIAMAAAWFAAAILPPMEPIDRLTARLQQTARRMRGEAAFAVYDQAIGGRWESPGSRANPSVLAGMAVVAAAALEQPDRPIGFSEYRMAPGAPSALKIVATQADAVALMIARPTTASVGYLLGALTDGQLATACEQMFGHSGFQSTKVRAVCPDCGNLDVKAAREPEATALIDLATSATVGQVLAGFWGMTDLTTTGGRVASNALMHVDDESGFARHLQAEAVLQGLSVYTGTMREEVLLARKGGLSWGVAGWYVCDQRVAARTDSVANRMFADVAWRVYCYRDVYLSTMIVPSAIAASGESKAGAPAWFLRRGKTEWPVRADGTPQ